MKILAFNNYDIKSISDSWHLEGQDAPSQHLWGCPELIRMGHDVQYLDWEGSAFLKNLSRKTRVLGDLDLQKRVLNHAAEYDVIYCGHQPTANALALLRKLGWLKTPVVAVGYQSPRSNSQAFKVWNTLFVDGLDKLLCLSDAMERDFARLGMDPARMEQIRWGVDLRYYQASHPEPQSEPHFVSIGKTFRDYHDLLQGFPFDRARLTIIGAGKSIDAVPPPAAEGRLTINTDWLEWRDFTRILPEYHGLVLPISMEQSRSNNAAGLTTVTEALASGLPVIVTDNPYLGVDVEAEGVGHWVARGDPKNWRKAISKICDDPDKLTRMRRCARALAESRINIDCFAKTLEQALLGAINPPAN